MHYAALCSSTGHTGQHWAWPSLVETLSGPGAAQGRCTCSSVPSCKHWGVQEHRAGFTKAHQCPAHIWEHTRDIPLPHCSWLHGGSQPAWNSLGVAATLGFSALDKPEHWSTNISLRQGSRGACYTCISTPSQSKELDLSHTEGSQRVMGYNHRNHGETQHHTSSGQNLVSQGFIWMLLPESQDQLFPLPILHFTPKGCRNTSHTIMAHGDCTLSLQRDQKKNEFHKQPNFKSSIILCIFYKIFVARCRPPPFPLFFVEQPSYK